MSFNQTESSGSRPPSNATPIELSGPEKAIVILLDGGHFQDTSRTIWEMEAEAHGQQNSDVQITNTTGAFASLN